MKFIVLAILIVSWSSYSFGSTESDIQDLKKRIEELEKQQEQLLISSSEPKNTVSSFLNNNLTFGGFFDGGYNFISGPDTDTQVVNTSNAIGLNFSADLGSKYRFVGQLVNILSIPLLNEDNNPTTSPKDRTYGSYIPLSVITQSYLEYNFSRLFNLQGGLGFTPFGFALQLREPVLYVRRGGPQITRINLVTPLWSGLHLYGSKAMGDQVAGYNLYTFTPTTVNSQFAGIGGRAWMSSDDDKIISGISGQIGKDDDDTFKTIGVDARFDFYPFQIRSEFIQHLSSEESDDWSAYLEPGYYIYQEELLLYISGDYYYGPTNRSGSPLTGALDPIQKWEYGVGVNWLPTSFTRLRFGLTYNDYIGNRQNVQGQNRDYLSIDLSAGVAF